LTSRAELQVIHAKFETTKALGPSLKQGCLLCSALPAPIMMLYATMSSAENWPLIQLTKSSRWQA